MGYYVVKHPSEPYKIQGYQSINMKVSKAGELLVKAE